MGPILVLYDIPQDGYISVLYSKIAIQSFIKKLSLIIAKTYSKYVALFGSEIKLMRVG